MRRSFGAGSGMGGGGGRGGGGGMLRSLRTIQRSVRTAGGGGGGGEPEDPISQSNNTNINKNTFSNNNPKTRPTYSNSTTISNTLSLSSSSSNFPLSAVPTWLSDNELDWEFIDGTEDEKYYDKDSVFGTVPSKDEAQYAVSALQQVFKPAYFSEMDGKFSSSGQIEPSLHLCKDSSELQLQSAGSESVHDAFRLLQTEPSVQRMVVSLSSDKAVWDAVLNNEVVRELRASLNEGGDAENGTITTGSKDEEGSTGSNAAMEILSRIFFNTKTKVMEFIEKITGLVYTLFSRHQKMKEGTATDPFEEKLRTSLMLSVVVFLVVVVSRSRKA